MTTIVTRAGKGSPLTYIEMDANFTNLNTAKLEAGTPGTNIANTPAGNIAAVTVQAALNELDAEKAKIGANSDITSLSSLAAVPTVITTAINASFAGKNKLYNPLGNINQRGYVSGTATSGANQYTLDRWRVVTSGQNLTFSTSGITTTMTAPAGGLEQVIEDNNIEGGVYTLNWTGTATATVNGSAITKGSQTASLSANSNVTIRFTNGTVSLPQFEFGSVATAFESRPYTTELILCQRYCQWVPFSVIGYASFPGQQSNQSIPLAVSMRTTPSFSSLTADPFCAQAQNAVVSNGFVAGYTSNINGLASIVSTTTGYFYTYGFRSLFTAEL